jgi:YHS domain-containing protein
MKMKMKSLWTVLLIAGLMTALALMILAQGNAATDNQKTQAKVPQTLCPVMKGKIKLNVYADYQGKRVYFCCGGCIEDFNKNAAKIIADMESQGIILDAAQVKCPVLGEKVDREVYVDYGGRRIYFCCKPCVDKFKQDPAKYSKKLDEDTAAAAGKAT